MASCLEFAFRIAKPPTTSLASVNGPSVTVIPPLDLRTRAPKALGKQPSVATSQPAFIPSSTNFPMRAISSFEGGVFLSADLYKLRNFINPPGLDFGAASRTGQSFDSRFETLGPAKPLPTNTSNNPRQNRQRKPSFFGSPASSTAGHAKALSAAGSKKASAKSFCDPA